MKWMGRNTLKIDIVMRMKVGTPSLPAWGYMYCGLIAEKFYWKQMLWLKSFIGNHAKG